MSMLLDALKKSEEQRQLGSTPDIHRTADHDPDGGGKSLPWVPLLLAAVAVTVMAWFGWNQLRTPEGSGAEPALAVAEPVAREAGSPAPVPVPATEPAKQPRTMVEQFSPAPSEDAGDPPAAQQQDQRREDVSRSFNQFAAKTPAQKTVPGKSAAAGSSSPAKAVAAVEPPDPDVLKRPDSAAPEPEASESWESGPMSYWALPQGVRDSLPEFRISVLVFADKPEDRFLLINGTRLKEQEELQSGVVLDEIRREGAVFRARNYRFLVSGG